jgi:hypothetical protein
MPVKREYLYPMDFSQNGHTIALLWFRSNRTKIRITPMTSREKTEMARIKYGKDR